MRQTVKWEKHEIGLILASLAMIAFLLIAQKVMGGSYYWRIDPKFAGSTLDSGRVVLWTGADSTSTKRLMLSGDSTAIDSVLDSILVSDTAVSRLVSMYYFFGQGAEGPYPEIIPPMFPRVSGGAVDSNRTELGVTDTGTYSISLLFADTSDGDTAGVPNVKVDLRGWNTSTLLGTGQRTNESGIVTYGTSGENLAFRGVGPTAQYVWPINWEDSVTISADLTDTVMGYFIDVPVASGSQVCAVTVVVLDNAGRAAQNVRVSAQLTRGNLRDSAGYAVANFTQNEQTDTLGRATFTCRWSSYLIPATKWRFTVKDPSVGQTKKEITVPRQASLTLEF